MTNKCHANIVVMGRIVNSFGVQGWVKIKSDMQKSESLNEYPELYLCINNEWSLFSLEKFFVKDNIIHAKFLTINDRDRALALKGTLIGVPREHFPKLAKDEFYWADLIKLKVYNVNNEFLGIVEDLLETGASSVLVIKGESGEHLIPFVAVYILDVNLIKKQITVDWGLDY